MKFYISSAGYFSRDEENGSLSLMVKQTNQILFFNRSCKKLLSRCDEWVDLDEFVDGLGITSVSRQRVYSDYAGVLYELNAYSLASLKDTENRGLSGCRFAALCDCAPLSDFMVRNLEAPFSCAVAKNQASYNLVSVYTRLRSKSEYFMLYEVNGKIQAVLSANTAGKVIGQSVLFIGSMVFDAALSEQECKKILSALIQFTAASFRESCNKIRNIYMHTRQDWLISALCALGFAQTAVFQKEIQRSRDVIFYDFFIS